MVVCVRIELVRDMKEMPSRPSLKMQSEVPSHLSPTLFLDHKVQAALTLSSLERQNRQVDDLLYKVMQKGI